MRISADETLPRHMRRGVIPTCDRIEVKLRVWCATQVVPGAGLLREGEHTVYVPESYLPKILELVETEPERMEDARRMYLQEVARSAAPACETTAAKLMEIPFEQWPDKAKSVEEVSGRTKEGFFRTLTGHDHRALLPTAPPGEWIERTGERKPPELPMEAERVAAIQRAMAGVSAPAGADPKVAELEAKVARLEAIVEKATGPKKRGS